MYAEQMKKCRLSCEEVQQLRHELLHHQEEVREKKERNSFSLKNRDRGGEKLLLTVEIFLDS